MRSSDPSKVVLVCRWRGRADRFEGKYKCFTTGKWKRIPGGHFGEAFNTKEKAETFARIWYEEERARRETTSVAVAEPADPTWNDICDAYITEVRVKIGASASSRHEAVTVTNANIRKGLLAEGKPADNDETRCLAWLRALSRENAVKMRDGATCPRKPKTVRNIAKHLRYLFRVALRRRMIPGMISNPTKGEDFLAELKAVMKADESRDWLVPAADFSKLVVHPSIPEQRRLLYLVAGLTGLRPGELAGLQFKHLRNEKGISCLVVSQQWSLPRSSGGANPQVTVPKTKWGRRPIPIHSALRVPLSGWVERGWGVWVGREHTDDDFVFCDEEGNPVREQRADRFRGDLEAAGCATTYEGEPLTPYALRHSFATMLMEAHASGDAADRLLGHRPRSVRTLNYTAKLLPFLAEELERIAFTIPDGAFPFAQPSMPSGCET